MRRDRQTDRQTERQTERGTETEREARGKKERRRTQIENYTDCSPGSFRLVLLLVLANYY